MFDKDSGLVKVWLDLILDTESDYTINDVPSISNLLEVILTELEQYK